MRKIVAAVLVVLIAGGVWWYASPIWTLHEMRAAAKDHDAARLSAYVDYPALREDVKSDVRSSLMPHGGIFGAAIAMVVVDPLVDAAVSPEGVEAMFAADRNHALPSAKAVPVTAGDHPVIDRDGFDVFRVHGGDASKGALVFRREGLSWKLIGIDMPANVRLPAG